MVTAVLYYQSQRRCTRRQLWILRKDREGCWGLSSTYPCQCTVAQMCHALQRRQGSRPGVWGVGGDNRFSFLFFYSFLSFCCKGKHYKVQNGNKLYLPPLFFFQLFPINVEARLSLVARIWYTRGRNVKLSIPNSNRHGNCRDLKLEMRNYLIPSLF